jgi:hypothetical protein
MYTKKKNFPNHACQFCGAQRKYVETIIDDEFVWDEKEGYVPNAYTDMFEHTGNQRCANCDKDWTGK